MTDYTTVTDSEIDQDSPITQPLLTALRDNPIAITEGASGAPKIQEAAMDSASVNQSALKTEVASASGSLNTSQSITITFGDYSFLPTSLGGGTVEVVFFGPTARLTNTSSTNPTSYSAQWRRMLA